MEDGHGAKLQASNLQAPQKFQARVRRGGGYNFMRPADAVFLEDGCTGCERIMPLSSVLSPLGGARKDIERRRLSGSVQTHTAAGPPKESALAAPWRDRSVLPFEF